MRKRKLASGHRGPIVVNEAFSSFVHSVTFFLVVVCFMLAYRNIVADVVDFFLDVS